MLSPLSPPSQPPKLGEVLGLANTSSLATYNGQSVHPTSLAAVMGSGIGF